MKIKTLLIIYILLLLFVQNLEAQTNDVRVTNAIAIVTVADSNIIEQFFEDVRIETNQPFRKINNVSEYENAMPLPISGWIEKDKIYSHDGKNILCTQSHLRTIYEPSETPTLFITYRDNASDTLNWVANEEVELEWVRIYGGIKYKCIQPHITRESWTPDITASLWQEIHNAECGGWVQPTGAHDAYQIGDCVIFNGDTYISKINNNVWSPAVYPAGWEKQ